MPKKPPGFYPRFAFLMADIYVDKKDPGVFWKLLYFGYQNIYDPALDEWIVIDKFEFCPGKVKLPSACPSMCP